MPMFYATTLFLIPTFAAVFSEMVLTTSCVDKALLDVPQDLVCF